MKKRRLDQLISDINLVESRSMAQRLIMAGQVRVNDQVVIKPATMVFPDAQITIDQGPKYVSRGGNKLEAALQQFQLLPLNGKICADVGASTGGFTDCLLSYGADKVYAVDVGHGILHWKLRQDSRVISYEKTNARHLEILPEKIDLITIDVSFISLTIIFPVIKKWFQGEDGIVVALVKPQFEAGKNEAARGKGVIRDKSVHAQILHEVLENAASQGFGIHGLMQSPLMGPKGNKEFLAHFGFPAANNTDIAALVETVFREKTKRRDASSHDSQTSL